MSDIDQTTLDNEQENVNIEKTNTRSRKNKSVSLPKIDDNHQVEISNNTFGKLIYGSKDGLTSFVLHEYGEPYILTYKELRKMKGDYPNFFKKRKINVHDEDVVKAMRLDRDYKIDVFSSDELEDLFDSHLDEIEDTIKKASLENKMLIAGMAREKYKNGELTDHRMIQILQERLEINLDDQV